MSPDPIDGDPSAPQSWNAYSYVVNNPLNSMNSIDPLGLDPVVFQYWSTSDSVTVFEGGFGPFGGLGRFSGVGVGDPTLMSMWTASGFNPTPLGWNLQMALGQAPRAGTPQGVGASGFWEGLIPIWGSGRAAINDFQTGHWAWGLANTGLAISDVFLVKSLAMLWAKLGLRGSSGLGEARLGELPRVGW
jgi:hypothetical protein